MKIENLVGKLPSKVRCPDCGLGKLLDIAETGGEVTPEIEARFTHVAEYHEQRHTKHSVEIRYYRVDLPAIETEM